VFPLSYFELIALMVEAAKLHGHRPLVFLPIALDLVALA
jgi:phosphate starvation-inducible membrane PsiE